MYVCRIGERRQFNGNRIFSIWCGELLFDCQLCILSSVLYERGDKSKIGSLGARRNQVMVLSTETNGATK
jgi:hypothetical protein